MNNTKEMTGILEANGFCDIKYEYHVLADDKECIGGEDITFHSATKEQNSGNNQADGKTPDGATGLLIVVPGAGVG